jgi:hypothetical protein
MEANSEQAQQAARSAIELSKQIEALAILLDQQKLLLRQYADGQSMEVKVEGLGKVSVSKPRLGGAKTGTKIEINLDVLEKNQELKAKLIERQLLKEVDVFSSSAAASVTIKPNV